MRECEAYPYVCEAISIKHTHMHMLYRFNLRIQKKKVNIFGSMKP